MTQELILFIITTVITVILGIIGYFLKRTMDRNDKNEMAVQELRDNLLTLSDKYATKAEIREIKASMEKIVGEHRLHQGTHHQERGFYPHHGKAGKQDRQPLQQVRRNGIGAGRMIERIRQKAFFKNNGMVLKAVNLLRDKFVALTDIRYALEPSMTEAEFRDSINYLTESGYIRLRHMDSKACTTLADTAMEQMEAKVTADGIKIIACVRKDECIDV